MCGMLWMLGVTASVSSSTCRLLHRSTGGIPSSSSSCPSGFAAFGSVYICAGKTFRRGFYSLLLQTQIQLGRLSCFIIFEDGKDQWRPFPWLGVWA